MKIGILAALDAELAGIVSALSGLRTVETAGRKYHAGVVVVPGSLSGAEVTAVACRIGKVAAASATTTLIIEHKVNAILVIGVAGAATPRVRRGDVVIARRLIQHDMNAHPIFPALEIPLTDRAAFDADAHLSAALASAASEYLARQLEIDFPPDLRARFGLAGDRTPLVIRGDIMTGDRFIADAAELDDISELVVHQAEALGIELDLCATEMEGAAVAQVCVEHGVPFAVARIISDSADAQAATDFGDFLRGVAGPYGAGIIRRAVALMLAK